MTYTADLIVVGAGLAGSAAAWAAAARGLSVVVLEAFPAGHRLGSSHGSARIFRRAYPDPLYVRLTGQAGELWRRLEAEAGESLLRLTGGLDFGPRRNPELLHAVLAACGVPAELVDSEAAAQRWPGISFDGGGPVMFHSDAGVLDPDRAMTAMLRLAVAGGADVRFGTPVTRLAPTPGGDGATAHTDGGTFTAPVAVVAAGAWMAPLIGDLVRLPPLTVTQQQVFHFGPRGQPAPPWPIFIYKDDIDDFYGLPGGRDGEVPGAIKLGEHRGGTAASADGRDFTVDPGARRRAVEFAGQRLPGLDSSPINEITCLYTSTANEDFILDRTGPIVIASACSGHGAKFAPLLGEILADLATGRPAPDPRFALAAHLRLRGSRLGAARPVRHCFRKSNPLLHAPNVWGDLQHLDVTRRVCPGLT
ncbi:MAG TPA: N-methyl-L-tryptophan oxidase [Trebonia sp.]